MRRRTTSALVSLLFLLPLSGAPAARTVHHSEDFVGAGAAQIAEADWLVREKGKMWWYFAMGLRYAGPGGIEAFGFVGRARCKKVKAEGMTIIMCMGKAREQEVDLENFWVEPDLSAGHLRLDSGTNTDEVRWTGDGMIEPFAWAEGSSYGAWTEGGAYRFATTEATIMGRELTGTAEGWDDFGVMAEVGGAGVFVPLRDFRFRPDGSLVARARFELPRR